MAAWTLLDEQTPRPVEVVERSSGLAIEPGVLGWEAKPEGLCRDEVCIPLPGDVSDRTRDGLIDVDVLARLLDRPVAIDTSEQVLAFAASPNERAAALRSGQAPDFELPDVDGVLHRLSDHQGRKIVLYAYASW
jgi:hypothetical protein